MVPTPRARRAAVIESAAPEVFVRNVADALAHLHDPAYLQTHPLAGCRNTAPRRSSESLGRSLAKALRESIDARCTATRQSRPARNQQHAFIDCSCFAI